MADTLTLFHGSPDPELSEIRSDGPFGGLFFASERRAGMTLGDVYYYVCELDSADVARSYDLQYGLTDEQVEAVDAVLTREFGDCSSETWDAVCGEAETKLDGWQVQRVRGLVAAALGYKAAQCSDEYGRSYLVLPGVEIRRVRDNER